MTAILTLREVGAMLRVSRSFLYAELAAGRIPGAFKVGADWRFDRVKVEQWMARGGTIVTKEDGKSEP